MDSINLDDFCSGGYFLVKAGRPNWNEPFGKLHPDKLISLSSCICKHLEVFWGWNPGDRQAALDFGIPESRLDEFIEWCGTGYESVLEVPSMFHSTDAARHFVKQFEVDTQDLFLIGAALPKELHKIWLKEETDNKGYAAWVKQGKPIEANGEALGFEVVSYGGYSEPSHSWLCSYLDDEMLKLFGIRGGQYGLLQKQEEAKQIADWINEDGYWGMRGEPEPYDYWLLLSYTLEET